MPNALVAKWNECRVTHLAKDDWRQLSIALFMPGLPLLGQVRMTQATKRIRTKFDARKGEVVLTPEGRYMAYKGQAQREIATQMAKQGIAPLGRGTIRIDMTVYYYTGGEVYDFDNLCKTVCDLFNDGRVWRDDADVAQANICRVGTDDPDHVGFECNIYWQAHA